MTGPLTEFRLSLLRRAAAADHISAATAEEKTALDELVEKDLIRHGQLTEAGASFIRALSTLRHFLARPSVAGQNQSSVTIRAQADDADCIGGNP